MLQALGQCCRRVGGFALDITKNSAMQVQIFILHCTVDLNIANCFRQQIHGQVSPKERAQGKGE